MATVVENIWAMLETVEDPELRVDIVNLGLIYDIQMQDENAVITMTWTMMGCPLADLLEKRIKEAVLLADGVSSVDINIVWEPAWTKDRLSRYAKILLGVR
ncbi:MAG: metal-sulfur cluster assembly factor [Lactobacillaceae bacterium]|jgi:metal-sulfur cluster biosynthetic enzyme|nr:metal-sulfur cluster assembly factor [Lactobacillaceae bacterium]